MCPIHVTGLCASKRITSFLNQSTSTKKEDIARPWTAALKTTQGIQIACLIREPTWKLNPTVLFRTTTTVLFRTTMSQKRVDTFKLQK